MLNDDQQRLINVHRVILEQRLNLKQLRLAFGMTRNYISRHLKCSQRTVINMENNPDNVKLSYLIKLSKLYKINLFVGM